MPTSYLPHNILLMFVAGLLRVRRTLDTKRITEEEIAKHAEDEGSSAEEIEKLKESNNIFNFQIFTNETKLELHQLCGL